MRTMVLALCEKAATGASQWRTPALSPGCDQPPGGFEDVDDGHADVHQCHVGVERLGQPHRFGSISGGANPLRCRPAGKVAATPSRTYPCSSATTARIMARSSAERP